jgi:hypothetical protein
MTWEHFVILLPLHYYDDCSLHMECILVNSMIQKTLYEYNVMNFCVISIRTYQNIERKILWNN